MYLDKLLIFLIALRDLRSELKNPQDMPDIFEQALEDHIKEVSDLRDFFYKMKTIIGG